MTEAELETADPQLLAAKLSEARSILYQVYQYSCFTAKLSEAAGPSFIEYSKRVIRSADIPIPELDYRLGPSSASCTNDPQLLWKAELSKARFILYSRGLVEQRNHRWQ
jgi:hypothetical protein